MPTSKAISASSFFGKNRYEYYLNELLTENTVGGQKLSKEELKEGFSKRKNKISFEKFVDKIVSTKAAKSSIVSSKKGLLPTVGGGINGPRGNALVRSPSGTLQKYAGVTQKVGGGIEENISAIVKHMSSVADTLTTQKKIDDDASAYSKRKAEQEKRGLAESKLEKRFEGLKKTAEKIIAPVKSLLDRILQFFTTVILGRIVYKLVEWLGNPENADKVKSIIRFLGDWGPALLGGFILFGTKFGKSVRVLTKIALSGIAKLAKAIPALLRFAKSNPRTAAAVAVGGYAATQLAQRAFSGEEQKVEQRAGGGSISVPRFSGGGFNLSGMLGGFRNYFSGLVTGEKGVDKIPAWLSDGEFVISAGAVRKYGVETFEAMNAAGGGTNKPTFKNESVYAQGGGMIGDIPLASSYGANPDVDTLRRAARVFRQFGTEEDLFKAFKKLNGVPDFAKMVGGENIYERIFQGHHGADDALDAIRQSVADKVKAVNNPQSFTQSSRAAAGLDDLAKKFDMDAKTAPRYAENLPRLNKPKSNLRGQFSNLPADYFSKAAQNVRQPIPASRAIVPYTGGGLVRSGVTAGLSVPEIQQIRTNMNVPGGRGGRGGIVGSVLLGLAEIFKPQVQAAVGDLYDKMGIGFGNLSNAELKKQIEEQTKRVQKLQSGPMGQFMDGGVETERLQFLQQEANKRRLAGLKGGKIMGGYGLKDQSFKDAPKTQIMSDDRGRPFVGYKAMRGGKLVYVRGPQAGTGTSNPLEALGRMINPGAYKDIDAENARKKYDEAARGSIASLKARGATQATIAKRQAELNRRKPVNPPVKPKPKVVVAGGGMNGRRGSGSKPSTSRPPSFSASTKGMRSKIETLGMMR
jgi:hypothetical protein